MTDYEAIKRVYNFLSPLAQDVFDVIWSDRADDCRVPSVSLLLMSEIVREAPPWDADYVVDSRTRSVEIIDPSPDYDERFHGDKQCWYARFWNFLNKHGMTLDVIVIEGDLRIRMSFGATAHGATQRI